MSTRKSWIPLLLLTAMVASSGLLHGCGTLQEGDEGSRYSPYDVYRQSLTVGGAAGSNCSTSVVDGLSKQLFAELNCLRPNTIADFSGLSGVKKNANHVYTFLQPAAITSLKKVLARRPGVSMNLTSALRSLAQQYLLYQWYRRGRCGIGLAASPGSSNHESGLALDVSPYSSWRSHFQAIGWRWLGSKDPVHFDYQGGGTVSLGGLSIKAFQRLWNRNNPSDKITEDGAWGPNTEARLAKSPTTGFAKSGCNNPPTPKLTAKFITQGAPGAYKGKSGAQYSLCPGQAFSFSFTLQNTGDINWTDINKTTHGRAVRLGHRGGERFGVPTRVSVNTTTNKDVKPSEQITFTMQAKAPTKGGTYRTDWQLVSELVAWFGPGMYLTFYVSNSPTGAGNTCKTGKPGACANGTLMCSGGKLTCTPPTDCDKQPPPEPPIGNETTPEATPEANTEPTNEPLGDSSTPLEPPGPDNTSAESIGVTESLLPDPNQPEAPHQDNSGVVTLPGLEQCSPACPGDLICANGKCVPKQKPAGGCSCSTTEHPAPPWSGLMLLALLGCFMTRRKRP